MHAGATRPVHAATPGARAGRHAELHHRLELVGDDTLASVGSQSRRREIQQGWEVGYTTLTTSVSTQIAKDAELMATRQIEGATWHFFQSPATGLGGPSTPLRQALEQAGIGIVIH
jgi:hypothetical protein